MLYVNKTRIALTICRNKTRPQPKYGRNSDHILRRGRTLRNSFESLNLCNRPIKVCYMTFVRHLAFLYTYIRYYVVHIYIALSSPLPWWADVFFGVPSQTLYGIRGGRYMRV